MKKKTDYTIGLIIGLFLLACLVSCSNSKNISKGYKPQHLIGHLTKGNAKNFQMRKDAKDRRNAANNVTIKLP